MFYLSNTFMCLVLFVFLCRMSSVKGNKNKEKAPVKCQSTCRVKSVLILIVFPTASPYNNVINLGHQQHFPSNLTCLTDLYH